MIEVEQSVDILKLFKFIDNLLILCPQRHGPWGVKKIHEFLLGKRFEKEVHKWVEGTPIMAKSNQPEIGRSTTQKNAVLLVLQKVIKPKSGDHRPKDAQNCLYYRK